MILKQNICFNASIFLSLMSGLDFRFLLIRNNWLIQFFKYFQIITIHFFPGIGHLFKRKPRETSTVCAILSGLTEDGGMWTVFL